LKAILSQFSRKKTTSKDGANGDSDDEEDEIVDDEEEEDGLDLARQASDEAVLEEIAYEVGEAHELSVAEDDLGRFALTKV
jgi:hypothetical protein